MTHTAAEQLIDAARRALEAMAHWGLDAAEMDAYVRLLKATHRAESEEAAALVKGTGT